MLKVEIASERRDENLSLFVSISLYSVRISNLAKLSLHRMRVLSVLFRSVNLEKKSRLILDILLSGRTTWDYAVRLRIKYN